MVEKQKQLEISQKAFAVGMRIEHSQEFINKSQYGKFYNHTALKAADYKLAVHSVKKFIVFAASFRLWIFAHCS